MDIQNGIKIGQASGSTFGDWINILIISNYPLGRGRNLSVIPQATIFWPLAKSVRLNIRDPKLKKKDNDISEWKLFYIMVNVRQLFYDVTYVSSSIFYL